MSRRLSSTRGFESKPSLQQLAQPALRVHPEWQLAQLAQALVHSPGTVGAVIVGAEPESAHLSLLGILTRAQVAEWRLDPTQWDPLSTLSLEDIQDHWLPAEVLQESLTVEEAIARLLARRHEKPFSPLWIAIPQPQGWGLWDSTPHLWQHMRGEGSLAPDLTDTTLSQLRQQNELILNSAGEGIYGLDANGMVTFANPAAARMIGWSTSELIGRSMHDLLHHSHPDHTPYPRTECPIYAAFRDGQVHHVVDEVFWRKDGTSFPVEYTSTPMRDEHGRLVGAVVTFQDITERKWAEAALKQAHEDLERKVQERTAELQRANQQLQELNEMKSRFVSMVCHEFRTPLNTILFAVTCLERYRHQLSETDQHHYVQGIQADIQHMTQMLDDVLLIGRTDARKLIPQPTQIELVQCCRYVIHELQLTHTEADIQFHSDRPQQNAYLDLSMLRSILLNMLSNAIKYSNPKQGIQFRLFGQQEWLVFEVEDQGIGIPPEDQPYLFDPFHRGSNVSTIPGTGLGLAILKRLVDLLAGHVEVSSQIGVGTLFRVRLPLRYQDCQDLDLAAAPTPETPPSTMPAAEGQRLPLAPGSARHRNEL
ncbi:PAS domain-containing sensor histidine kinase [Synechococcus sp. Nb3U1]|uniref:sensor histidine kinase n=1 Tax=Synechococcus sp. Nb3U1 TaxID=1914529 RepID=UPI001F2C53B8|nr:ATP-binding protein [Synechococcus sp. Nb3U1]MCF2971877.1 PAS domain-containing sensor histidine kinase [Synechococcus sp. Nb3U1]